MAAKAMTKAALAAQMMKREEKMDAMPVMQPKEAALEKRINKLKPGAEKDKR